MDEGGEGTDIDGGCGEGPDSGVEGIKGDGLVDEGMVGGEVSSVHR